MSDRIKSLEEVKDPEAFLEAHYKAFEDLQRLRGELTEATKELDTLKESTSDEAVAKWRDRAIKAAVKNAVEGEGIKGADRILKYLNLEGVDFDENEKLTGLDEKLTEVKTDFPELFDAKRRAGSQSADIHANKDVKVTADPFRESVRSALNA